MRNEALAGGVRARGAFERLWKAYFGRLCLYVLSFRGLPEAEREDVVADSLIAAFNSIASFDPNRSLTAWIYAIAHNRCADEVRKQRRHSAILLGPSAEEESGFEPESEEDHAQEIASRLSDAELEQACARALAELPEEDRRIASLRFMEGLDSTEIGKVLHLPPGTVRWRIHRIRAAVSARLGVEP